MELRLHRGIILVRLLSFFRIVISIYICRYVSFDNLHVVRHDSFSHLIFALIVSTHSRCHFVNNFLTLYTSFIVRFITCSFVINCFNSSITCIGNSCTISTLSSRATRSRCSSIIYSYITTIFSECTFII